MNELRPKTERHIVFQNPDREKYLWACSHCEWNTPYLLPENSRAVDPIEVVSNFEGHVCLDFQSKQLRIVPRAVG
jgi:hypothetical protein